MRQGNSLEWYSPAVMHRQEEQPRGDKRLLSGRGAARGGASHGAPRRRLAGRGRGCCVGPLPAQRLGARDCSGFI